MLTGGAMTHFKSNLRDIEFNLFEVLDRQELFGSAPHEDLDEGTARGILAEVERLAAGPLAESFADADRQPAVFDPATHAVTMPESFARSFRAWMDAEWFRLELPPGLGGSAAPRSLCWGVAELMLGANPAVWMYGSGAAFSKALYLIGTDEQKRVRQAGRRTALDGDDGADRARRWVGRRRGPDQGHQAAGRHLAHRGRQALHHERRARHGREHLPLRAGQAGGRWSRAPRACRCSWCPSTWSTPTAQLGERNGVYATNVEHKMGLKVSTTCELTFGAEHPAIGTLVGDVHDGIRQMFMIIEHARMMVGTKAIATLSTGYLNALDYAKNRVQGGELAKMTDKTAPRVTIIHHPDVRRILMLQKAYAEGMRALVLYTATFQDAEPARPGGRRPDERAIAMNDLLLPLVKGRRLRAGLRDADAVAADLRRVRVPAGLPARAVHQGRQDRQPVRGHDRDPGHGPVLPQDRPEPGPGLDLAAQPDQGHRRGDNGNGRLKKERAALARATDNFEAMVNAMHGFLASSLEQPGEMNKIGFNTTRLLLALGDLVIGWLLVRQSEVATAALDAGSASAADTAFYLGKVAAARFFAETVLPRLAAEREIVETTTTDLMDLPEAAF